MGEEKVYTEWLSLPGRVRDIEGRLMGILNLGWLSDQIERIYNPLDREKRLIAELERRKQEVAQLNAEFSKSMKQIREREGELDEIRDLLEDTLSEWMNLSTIDKIKVLDEFTLKIETVLDNFGNVVRRRPIVVSR